MSFDQTQFESLTSDIVYSAKFVPYSQSRNAGKRESINWIVSLSVGKQELNTDYSQGIGHFPQVIQNSLVKVTLHTKRVVTNGLIEQGRIPAGMLPEIKSSQRALHAPPLTDVLYSLISDASVIDYAGFEDWASEFGYSEDSREAERTYRACLEIALKLRSMLGDTRLEQLRELFQDY